MSARIELSAFRHWLKPFRALSARFCLFRGFHRTILVLERERAMNETARVVFYIIGLAGGLFLWFKSIRARRDGDANHVPRWSLMSAAGLLCVVWSALGFILLYSSTNLTPRTLYVVQHLKTLLAGAAVGLLVAVLMGGHNPSPMSQSKI